MPRSSDGPNGELKYWASDFQKSEYLSTVHDMISLMHMRRGFLLRSIMKLFTSPRPLMRIHRHTGHFLALLGLSLSKDFVNLLDIGLGHDYESSMCPLSRPQNRI